MNTVYKGEETPASLDWEYYSPKELYDIMRNGERVLTTQVPPEEFKNVFTSLASIYYLKKQLKDKEIVVDIVPRSKSAESFCHILGIKTDGVEKAIPRVYGATRSQAGIESACDGVILRQERQSSEGIAKSDKISAVFLDCVSCSSS